MRILANIVQRTILYRNICKWILIVTIAKFEIKIHSILSRGETIFLIQIFILGLILKSKVYLCKLKNETHRINVLYVVIVWDIAQKVMFSCLSVVNILSVNKVQ